MLDRRWNRRGAVLWVARAHGVVDALSPGWTCVAPCPPSSQKERTRRNLTRVLPSSGSCGRDVGAVWCRPHGLALSRGCHRIWQRVVRWAVDCGGSRAEILNPRSASAARTPRGRVERVWPELRQILCLPTLAMSRPKLGRFGARSARTWSRRGRCLRMRRLLRTRETPAGADRSRRAQRSARGGQPSAPTARRRRTDSPEWPKFAARVGVTQKRMR